MARKKPSQLDVDFFKIIRSKTPKEATDIKSADSSPLRKVLKQRHEHRAIVFWFSIVATGLTLSLLLIAIGFQAWVRFRYGNNFTLFQGYELEILSVGVFAQFIGVIAIITKSLWDDSPYKDIWPEK